MPQPSKLEAQQLAAAVKWKAAYDALKAAETEEEGLRAEAVAICFPAGLDPGTTSLKLHDGSTLKAVIRKRSKVDPTKIGGALLALRRKFKALGKLLGERLIKWTPEASIAEWNKLTDEQRAFFDGVVTVAGGAPSLDLIAAD